LSELESYHRILTISKSMPQKRSPTKHSVQIPNTLGHFIYYLDDSNFSGRIKDEYGFVTDETIARSMTLSDDKSWMKNIQLQTFSMLDFLPDEATKRMFGAVMNTLMRADRNE
jgi:hypothetical protein